MREGDTVVVHSMDRLARNLDDLRRLVQKLTGRGVRIEFVKECLTFTGEDSPMANLMLSVMGAFAEFERALIRERQREGIALAKQRGAYRGRKALSPERAAELLQRVKAGEQRQSWPVNLASAAKRCTSTCAKLSLTCFIFRFLRRPSLPQGLNLRALRLVEEPQVWVVWRRLGTAPPGWRADSRAAGATCAAP